jgi:hypothetical protein
MAEYRNVEYRNAKFVTPDNLQIDCEINHPEYGWIPYLLDPADTDMTIDNTELKASMDQNGDVAAFNQQEYDDKIASLVRLQRDNMLQMEVDPIVSNALRWADMTTEEQNAWTAYRTALLDITDQAGFPHSVTWPTKPE